MEEDLEEEEDDQEEEEDDEEDADEEDEDEEDPNTMIQSSDQLESASNQPHQVSSDRMLAAV